MSQRNESISAQDMSSFLASRRVTRDFLPTPIAPEILQQVLTDAMTAPIWSNTRPYMIAIAEGEQRDRISAEFQKRWEVVAKQSARGWMGKLTLLLTRYGLPTSNRIVSKPYTPDLKPRAVRVGKELYQAFGIKREDRDARDNWWAQNYKFFGAPTELFFYVHKSLDIFAANDAGLMMENLILSAHAHGLGTCPQGAVSIWDDVVRKEFDVLDGYRLLCGLAIGYPSDSSANEFNAHRIGADEITINSKSKE